MKIIETNSLAIPAIKTVRFARFKDNRGYFTETFRQAELKEIIGDWNIQQCNESFSAKNVIRGLHFQWNPFMGKFVRTIQGHMVDLVLDIRKNSPTFGKILAYDLPANSELDYNEWIWVPPGFAHGNFFLAPSTIEYYCSGAYSPGCEAGISPIANDIDWSLCDAALKEKFFDIIKNGAILSDKDKNGLTLAQWSKRKEASLFLYE